MPSPTYKPRDAVVDTSMVLFGSKRNRSFECDYLDPASSLISSQNNNRNFSSTCDTLVVYDKTYGEAVIQPMTKASPSYRRMKKQRKRRTAVAGAGGAIFGGIVGGPAGAIFIGAGAAVVTRKVCKVQQKRAQRKSEHDSFQAAALDMHRAVHSHCLV